MISVYLLTVLFTVPAGLKLKISKNNSEIIHVRFLVEDILIIERITYLSTCFGHEQILKI